MRDMKCLVVVSLERKGLFEGSDSCVSEGVGKDLVRRYSIQENGLFLKVNATRTKVFMLLNLL